MQRRGSGGDRSRLLNERGRVSERARTSGSVELDGGVRLFRSLRRVGLTTPPLRIVAVRGWRRTGGHAVERLNALHRWHDVRVRGDRFFR